ncbi:hypothetical protein LFT51_22610 [Mycobacterium intracellulare subsp. chimaera]|uniref:hypothetical protein n=1 Tax=Mycobacterium intracellulare TaxID=1767 RepID=UPI0013A07D9B|nr:hypothetical protein [Mycobacterium intracellulare]MCA2354126.1 hypothetical protein [Mycobacterium intracellulare subsp. chimaera]UCN07005.1 hypothetical protein LFT51_22610 [Mycobacterium intracellulare subsp. chimaera]
MTTRMTQHWSSSGGVRNSTIGPKTSTVSLPSVGVMIALYLSSVYTNVAAPPQCSRWITVRFTAIRAKLVEDDVDEIVGDEPQTSAGRRSCRPLPNHAGFDTGCEQGDFRIEGLRYPGCGVRGGTSPDPLGDSAIMFGLLELSCD